ncbi:MAG: questin oxidase family protein [Pyrinomonadaceae bacterium]
MLHRREFIRTASAFAGSALLLPAAFGGCAVKPEFAMTAQAADAMDEALTLMAKFAPLGNHAPMAVESLIALGRADRAIPFIEKYEKRFNVGHPAAVSPITTSNWKEALGRGERNLDWVNFFKRQLTEADWKPVVEEWAGILAPGLCAAAGHGVIRTCHALRSLSNRQTNLRLNELAEGLGYWAAYYQPLPESSVRPVEAFSLPDAVKRVPMLPDDKRRRGSIMDQLRALDDFAAFGDVINSVKVSGKADAVISQLTEVFVRVYLERVTPANDLILIHAVTATSGIRSLLPYLTPETTDRVLRYGWQTAAALLSISGDHPAVQRALEPELKIEDLTDRAVSSNEEHAIKFTEACIREQRLNPNPIYQQAATDAVRRLPRH